MLHKAVPCTRDLHFSLSNSISFGTGVLAQQRSCSPTPFAKWLSATICVLSPPPETTGLYYFTFWLKWCHLQIKARPGIVIESQVVYWSDLQQACTCPNIQCIKDPPCPTQYWLDLATKSHLTRVEGSELECSEIGRKRRCLPNLPSVTKSSSKWIVLVSELCQSLTDSISMMLSGALS